MKFEPDYTLGADSEVGTLRTVMLHRPGDELRRLTPRNNDQLLFDGLPWVDRARDEHDAFADLLTGRGVELLLLGELLAETLAHSDAARVQGIAAAVDPRRLGHVPAKDLAMYLRGVPVAELAQILMAGMTFDELAVADGDGTSLVRRMHHGGDFVIEPLPNLLLASSRSAWGSAPPRPARKRWRAACSTTTWLARSSLCPSRRSEYRCISIRS